MEENDRPLVDTDRVTGPVNHFIQLELFFRAIYEEYKKPLGTFLYRLLAEEHKVEDLYQEVLKKFWIYLQTIRRLPTVEETRRWLFTVARHQAIDEIRKWKNWDSIGDMEPSLRESAPMEDQLCEQDRLRQALKRMTYMYRICVVLQDMYGYSQKEIAVLLNIKESTVSTNVLRGRKQLIQLLRVLDDVHRKKEETTYVDESTK